MVGSDGPSVLDQREHILASLEEGFNDSGDGYVYVNGSRLKVNSKLEGLQLQHSAAKGAEKARLAGLVIDERRREKQRQSAV